MIFHRVLCVLLTAWTIYADPRIESEYFEEDLTIRPLRDGRLGARFSFTTTLQSKSPRNPQSLDEDDDCVYTRPRMKIFRALINPETQPSTIPFSPSRSAKSFGNTQSPNCTSHSTR